MTTTASGRKATAACNGATVDFAIPFQFQTGGLRVFLLDDADAANEDGDELTEGVDFTLSGDGEAGTASLTTATAYAAGKYLRRWRETPLAQDAIYTPNDGFPARAHERQLDRLSMVTEEQADDLAGLDGRALKVPHGEAAGTLPPHEPGKFLLAKAGGGFQYSEGTGADDGLRSDLAAPDGGAHIGFQIAAAAFEQTIEEKARQRVSVADFGVTGDGVTNDTAAMLEAIDHQQATGCILEGIAGGNAKLDNWVTPVLTEPFYFDGNLGRITCGTGTKTAFVTAKARGFIRHGIFTDFYRIVSNPTGTTGTLDGFWFYENIVTNTLPGADNFAYALLLQNADVLNVFVYCNTFTNVKVAAVHIGDDVYASQDNRRRIFVFNNSIDGVTISSGASQIFGIIVYGEGVLITENDIANIELGSGVYSVSNGISAIYTKSRFARVVSNHVHDIGITATNSGADPDQIIGINLKGRNRSVNTAPNAYGQIANCNTVDNVGTGAIGVGISCDHLGVGIYSNWIERCGRTGISGGEGTNPTAGDCIKVNFNTIIMRANAFAGTDIFTSTGNQQQIGNTIVSPGAPSIRLRAQGVALKNGLITLNQLMCTGSIGISMKSDGFDVVDFLVTQNVLLAGDYGFLADDDGGHLFTRVSVLDNNFFAAATAAMAGVSLGQCRTRNNRGYVSENGGMSAAIATGATIAHGLSGTPTVFHVTPTAACTDVYVTADAANLTVNFGGGGNVAFSWEAKLAGHYA